MCFALKKCAKTKKKQTFNRGEEIANSMAQHFDCYELDKTLKMEMNATRICMH